MIKLDLKIGLENIKGYKGTKPLLRTKLYLGKTLGNRTRNYFYDGNASTQLQNTRRLPNCISNSKKGIESYNVFRRDRKNKNVWR